MDKACDRAQVHPLEPDAFPSWAGCVCVTGARRPLQCREGWHPLTHLQRRAPGPQPHVRTRAGEMVSDRFWSNVEATHLVTRFRCGARVLEGCSGQMKMVSKRYTSEMKVSGSRSQASIKSLHELRTGGK